MLTNKNVILILVVLNLVGFIGMIFFMPLTPSGFILGATIQFIKNSTSNGYRTFSDIAINKNFVYIVFAKRTSTAAFVLHYTVSKDYGKTFSEAKPLARCKSVLLDLKMKTHNNKVVVKWVEGTENEGYTTYLSYSLDEGETFSKPISLKAELYSDFVITDTSFFLVYNSIEKSAKGSSASNRILYKQFSFAKGSFVKEESILESEEEKVSIRIISTLIINEDLYLIYSTREGNKRLLKLLVVKNITTTQQTFRKELKRYDVCDSELFPLHLLHLSSPEVLHQTRMGPSEKSDFIYVLISCEDIFDKKGMQTTIGWVSINTGNLGRKGAIEVTVLSKYKEGIAKSTLSGGTPRLLDFVMVNNKLTVYWLEGWTFEYITLNDEVKGGYERKQKTIRVLDVSNIMYDNGKLHFVLYTPRTLYDFIADKYDIAYFSIDWDKISRQK